MPAQIIQSHRSRPEPNCPEWVEALFTAAAGVGLFLLLWTAISVYFETHDLSALWPGSGYALVCGLVLWRQYLLKRWACLTACLTAWSIAIWTLVSVWNERALALPAHRGLFEWGCLAVIVLLAPAMTAALVAGWKGLERGC